MACDSCMTYGDTHVGSGIKIRRLASGALLGQAGDNDARAMIAILDKIKDPLKLPSKVQLAETKDSFMGILALPKGGVWIIASGPTDEMGWPADADEDYGVWAATTIGGYAAVGSGFDHALAAMDAGASAKFAVEIACRRNINCRPPVHLRRLSPEKKVNRKRGTE